MAESLVAPQVAVVEVTFRVRVRDWDRVSGRAGMCTLLLERSREVR